MLKFKRSFHSLIILFVLSLSTNSYAMEKEYMLKAGFLYNFARFGQWHTSLSEQKAFTLCSPDQNFIDIANVALKNRTIQDLPLRSKFISFEELASTKCNMLFITSDTVEAWNIAKPLMQNNIMVVGETDVFIQNGGHIRFFLSSGKIRFEIAPKQLKDAGITMSSKVLRLARVVDR
ncbi:YfiR family protein [Pseudoalteromonas distincta]|uniref:YfiR family protein n=2 Tax=Pseudoalteromonas TaxID=53246 RepID=UPI00351CCE69